MSHSVQDIDNVNGIWKVWDDSNFKLAVKFFENEASKDEKNSNYITRGRY